uniref:Uncharacterized protein n=1 Tax=Rhizophora mucronata TaxID=61149 RepID=A0A2P2J318_RHIMU
MEEQRRDGDKRLSASHIRRGLPSRQHPYAALS